MLPANVKTPTVIFVTNLVIVIMYSLSTLVCFAITFIRTDGWAHPSRDPQQPPIPYHSVFNNGKGKTPLVAATYYFNSEPEIKREFIKEAVFADNGENTEENQIPNAVNQDFCQAADGRKGSCYDATECVNKGGMPMGRCDSGSSKRDGSVCCLCKWPHV